MEVDFGPPSWPEIMATCEEEDTLQDAASSIRQHHQGYINATLILVTQPTIRTHLNRKTTSLGGTTTLHPFLIFSLLMERNVDLLN
jgi:hypothetical protein